MEKTYLIRDALLALMQLLEEAGISPVACSVMTDEETYIIMGRQDAK